MVWLLSAAIKSYRDLIAWQKAFALGCRVQTISHAFPRHEIFGLTSQVRRAGTSVALNIAEGYGRGSTGDYLRFLRTSRGSLYELSTAMAFARSFGYLAEDDHRTVDAMILEAERVLAGLIRSLESRSS